MADRAQEAAVAARLLAAFEAKGAQVVTPDCLQPAALLLDLYGESIRARAYTAHDPVDGELMLRPDFTVPVAQAHFTSGRGAARYAYAGPVWRRQDPGSARGRENWQAGFEVFEAEDPAEAEALVFSTITSAVAASGATPRTGDLGFIFAAIAGLKTTETRKAALRRHVWRPGRFSRLLARYAGTVPFEVDSRTLPKPPSPEADLPGRRGAADVAARLEALEADRQAPALAKEEVALFSRITSLAGPSDDCHHRLAALAAEFPSLDVPVAAFARRLEAFDRSGIAPAGIPFDGGFGRQSMEYYDGFVFAFEVGDGPAVAQGGRYDPLTAVLGGGQATPAVGGVVRPAVLAELEGRA